MAAVTAGMVKELREMTGVGMLDCKKALAEVDGNIEKAVELLREKGLAAASQKAGRIASEGVVYIHVTDDNKKGVIIEINSETDFVAKNATFKEYVGKVAEQAVDTNATTIADFGKETWKFDSSVTVEEALSQQIATIGENLSIRRFEKFERTQAGALVSYTHGDGRIAVMIELACEKEDAALNELGRNIAMQIAALNPKFIATENVPADFIAKEKEILTQQAMNDEKNANKPANIIEKMIEGRLAKELKEFCLIEQSYVKDGEMTVKKYIDSVAKEVGAPISITRFVRFETGEGLAKKEENFADEVAKAIQ